MSSNRLHVVRLLTRLEGRIPALRPLLARSHARRFDALAPRWDTIGRTSPIRAACSGWPSTSSG